MRVVNADFQLQTIFLKNTEAKKLAQKTKLESIKYAEAMSQKDQDFLEKLVYIDFNNRGLESTYK